MGAVFWIRKIIENWSVTDFVFTYRFHATHGLTIIVIIRLALQNTLNACLRISILFWFVSQETLLCIISFCFKISVPFLAEFHILKKQSAYVPTLPIKAGGSSLSPNFPKSILIFETFSNSFWISVIFYKGLRYKRTQNFSDTWDTLTLNVQIILQHVRKWHLQNLFYHVFLTSFFPKKNKQIKFVFSESQTL